SSVQDVQINPDYSKYWFPGFEDLSAEERDHIISILKLAESDTQTVQYTETDSAPLQLVKPAESVSASKIMSVLNFSKISHCTASYASEFCADEQFEIQFYITPIFCFAAVLETVKIPEHFDFEIPGFDALTAEEQVHILAIMRKAENLQH